MGEREIWHERRREEIPTGDMFPNGEQAIKERGCTKFAVTRHHHPEIMVASRRGSGTLTLPSGQTLAYHTRTHDEEGLPHATKKCVQPLLGGQVDSTDIAQDNGRSPPSSREPVRFI